MLHIHKTKDLILKEPLCVELEIEHRPHRRNQRRILVTLNVYEDLIHSPIGDISVGLKRFRLELTLQNGHMPLMYRKLIPSLTTVVEKDRTTKNLLNRRSVEESESGGSAAVDIKGPTIKASNKEKRTNNMDVTTSTSDVFTRQDWQVIGGGDAKSPSWAFEDQEEKRHLQGAIKNEELGLLEIATLPCQINAEAKAFDRDLVITGRSGLLPDDLSTNNRIVRQMVIKVGSPGTELEFAL